MNGAYCVAMMKCGTPWETAHYSYNHRNNFAYDSYKLVYFTVPFNLPFMSRGIKKALYMNKSANQ